MKRRIFTYSTFVLLLGLSACTQDGLPTDGAEGTPMTFTATGLDFPEVRSRATVDGNWTGVSTVAVKIGDEVKDYTVTPSTDGLSATLTSTDPFYWTRTEPVTVSAWPKADASSADMPLVVVQADQSGDGFAKSDFIAAEPQEVSIGAPSLKFTHRTARLTVTLTPGDGINSVEGATVNLLGLNTTNGNPSSITAHHVAEKAVYEALVAPQSIAQGTTFITVTLNGTTYSYAPKTAGIELEAGNRYNYTVKVNAKGLELESVSGGEWTDSGTSEDVYTFYKSDLDEAEVGDYLTTDGKLIDGDAGSMLPDEIKAQIAAVVFWTPKQPTSEGRHTPASLKDDLIMHADYPNCTHGLAVALKDATYNGSESMVWQNLFESVATTFQSGENFSHDSKENFKSIASGSGEYDPINYILGYQNTVVLRAYNTYCQNNKSGYIVQPVAAIGNFAKDYPAPTNSTDWFLPSPKELHILCYKDVDNIYNNSGVENYNIVNSSLTAAGGDGLNENRYWSSGEFSFRDAWSVSLDNGRVYDFIKPYDAYVRLVVAF